MKTAILVDGGFYRKRAAALWGVRSAKERAKELIAYCQAHIKNQGAELYRVFYYDCAWSNQFLDELRKARKFAVRLGSLSEISAGYNLKGDTTKKLFSEKITIDDITENDFSITIEQKGVDMKLGIDISSMAYKKQVDQIILISGDSDFVPAAKLARREGIDFILDPMWAPIKNNLPEHVDGIHSCWNKKNGLGTKAAG